MQYPLQEGDIRLEYPEITEDQTGDTFPLPDGYVEVEQTPQPSFDGKTQYLSQSDPIQLNGVWQSVWVVNDLTPEQISRFAEAKEHRARKNKPPTTNSGSTPDVIA